jgi:hypothetical protein
MTEPEAKEIALVESDRMRIQASIYRQMGFKELARFLDKNAEAALKFASGSIVVKIEGK